MFVLLAVTAIMAVTGSVVSVQQSLPPGTLRLHGAVDDAIRKSVENWTLGEVPYHAFADFFRKGRPQFALGEMWGKFVRAAAFQYRYTGDERIRERIEDAVRDARFPLRLRIPGWSERTVVRVGGELVANVRPGSYLTVDRLWRPGDLVEIAFDWRARRIPAPHGSNPAGDSFAAVTWGPFVLARDENTDAQFARSGVPYDSYLAEDFTADPGLASRYKAVFRYDRNTPVLSTSEIRRRVGEAGGYLPVPSATVEVDMNGDFLSVHAIWDCKCDFKLPFPCRVVNLKNGREEKVVDGRLPLKMKRGETCWFSLEGVLGACLRRIATHRSRAAESP